MGRFEDRFGIDYSTQKRRAEGEWGRASDEARGRDEGGAEAAREQRSSWDTQRVGGMEEALLSYGGRMLEKLAGAPDRTQRVFDLAHALGLRADISIRVVDYLRRRTFVTVVAEDQLGNDLVRLTERGAQFLSGKPFDR